MANLSDIIEHFILEAIGGENRLEIGRNELASHFSVAPSQINYVLSTRFTTDRGYVIESHRGGGGYIILERINNDNLSYLNNLLKERNAISYREGAHIIERLVESDLITEDEATLIMTTISDRALNSPFNINDNIRASILKEIIIKLKAVK